MMYMGALAKVQIRAATVFEWPQISTLIARYRARVPRNSLALADHPDECWYVALLEERVIGAYSTVDDEPLRIREVFNVLRVEDVAGAVAVDAMLTHVKALADADQRQLLYSIIDPDDPALLRAMKRHGFRPTGILMERLLEATNVPTNEDTE
jgi:RimJ/RimL family protein N-acetyltransferase